MIKIRLDDKSNKNLKQIFIMISRSVVFNRSDHKIIFNLFFLFLICS